MANFRTVNMQFWTDAKVSDDFSRDEKYLFLYLLTNPHTNLAGCYEMTVKQAADETDMSKDEVRALLESLEHTHKVIRYSTETKEVLLLNWHKYGWTTSVKFRESLRKDIIAIKNAYFKKYLIGKFNAATDTVSIPYPENEIVEGYSSDITTTTTTLQHPTSKTPETHHTTTTTPCAHARDEDGTAVVDGGSFEQEIIQEEQADAFETVWAAFEKLNINLPASTAGNDIARYLNAGMEPAVLLQVADISGNSNAQSWKYPKAILEKYLKRGILTVQQAMDDSAAFENQKARRKREQEAKAAGTRPADFYDPADYAKDDPDGTAWAEMFESLQAHCPKQVLLLPTQP